MTFNLVVINMSCGLKSCQKREQTSFLKWTKKHSKTNKWNGRNSDYIIHAFLLSLHQVQVEDIFTGYGIFVWFV